MQVWQATQDLKHAGLIENVGASIYSPKDLEPFGHDMIADIIQAPFNIFDQRILKSGWLDVLHNCGTKIHARSVFYKVFFFKTSINCIAIFILGKIILTILKNFVNFMA